MSSQPYRFSFHASAHPRSRYQGRRLICSGSERSPEFWIEALYIHSPASMISYNALTVIEEWKSRVCLLKDMIEKRTSHVNRVMMAIHRLHNVQLVEVLDLQMAAVLRTWEDTFHPKSMVWVVICDSSHSRIHVG